ncbi:MAG TPA: hypothetical protein VGM77_04355 [Gemmatimonadales bacterium]|jgi:hypothetical protein
MHRTLFVITLLATIAPAATAQKTHDAAGARDAAELIIPMLHVDRGHGVPAQVAQDSADVVARYVVCTDRATLTGCRLRDGRSVYFPEVTLRGADSADVEIREVTGADVRVDCGRREFIGRPCWRTVVQMSG